MALFLGLAAAQAPSSAPTNQATGDAALNGASLDYFPRDHLFRILGKEVLSAKGEDMGRIVDVLFDEKGEPHAAVIDFGGFLGVGTRKIAISWSALRFDLGEKKNVIALDLGREQLKAAPEYKYTNSDKPIPVVAQPQPPPHEPAARSRSVTQFRMMTRSLSRIGLWARPAAEPMARSLRGLDWLNFFVANFQTGFGPFISVYLTGVGWTQGAIGAALSAGTVAGMVSQVPGGILVDAVRSKRAAAAVAIMAIMASALLIALWPALLPIASAEILHAFASSVLGPAIAALSLALVGHAALGERLGRNARYLAIGNAFAAGLMGTFGYYVGERAVFLLTAALGIPALAAIEMIRSTDLPPAKIRPETGTEVKARKYRLVMAISSETAGCSPMLHAQACSNLPMRRCCRLPPGW